MRNEARRTRSAECPTSRDALPARRAALQASSDALPSRNDPVPMNRDDLPTGSDASPIEREALPGRRVAPRAGRDLRRTRRDALRTGRDARRTGRDAVRGGIDARSKRQGAFPIGTAAFTKHIETFPTRIDALQKQRSTVPAATDALTTRPSRKRTRAVTKTGEGNWSQPSHTWPTTAPCLCHERSRRPSTASRIVSTPVAPSPVASATPRAASAVAAPRAIQRRGDDNQGKRAAPLRTKRSVRPGPAPRPGAVRRVKIARSYGERSRLASSLRGDLRSCARPFAAPSPFWHS